MEESATEEMSSQMGHEGSSQSGRGKNKKHWTAEEDKALVESLLELVDSGTHRGDNGFKPGYLTILEEKMISRGHTAIKGNPHIASRLKLLKQDYGMYAEMLTSDGLSGFGYNSHTGCIEAPDSVWDSVLQTKSKKFGRLRYKAFPHYNDLHVVFGRDRATGNEAMSFADMVEEDANEEAGIGGPPFVPAAGQTRKRKRSSPTNEIASAIKEIGEKITETGKVLSTALQADQKMDMQRQLTRDIMKIDPMMPIEQEMFLLGKIGKDVDMLNMFSEWDDEKKARFVTSLLNGRVRDPNLNDHNV